MVIQAVRGQHHHHAVHSLGKNGYHHNGNAISKFEREQYIPAMAKRSFHLPGNNVLSDYVQYIRNNHPLISLCCHHRLHPITTKMRLLNFWNSFMFGLSLTNIMWLWYLHNSQGSTSNGGEQQAPIALSYHWTRSGMCGFIDNKTNTSLDLSDCNTTDVSALSDFINDTASKANDLVDDTDILDEYDVVDDLLMNHGMVLLWTIGAVAHAFFDVFIWYLEVIYCCLPPKITSTVTQNKYTQLEGCGLYIVTFACVTVTAVATLIPVIYAASDYESTIQEAHDEGFVNSSNSYNESSNFNTTSDAVSSYSLVSPSHNNYLSNITNPFEKYNVSTFHFHVSNIITGLQHHTPDSTTVTYKFVVSYFGEILFALFVYYPIIVTILFSGILGCCGVIPILGGRPYEVKIEEHERKKKILLFARAKNGVVA